MIYIFSIPLLLFIAFVFVHNHLTGKRLILDFLHYRTLKKLTLTDLDNHWQKDENHSDVIVSLSTIPERINFIDQTIKSLLYQKRLPKKIVLNIPYESFRNGEKYIVPEWLKNLQSISLS